MVLYNGIETTKKHVIVLLCLVFVYALALPTFAAFPYDEQIYLQNKLLEAKQRPKKQIKTEKYYDERSGKLVDVVAGEVLVKYHAGVSTQSFRPGRPEATIKRTLPGQGNAMSNSQEISLPVKDLVEAYKKESDVEYVEPNFIVRAMSITPNDPYYSLQWALPLIKADKAWDINTGESNVVIAIIDSGMDLLHPDLTNQRYGNYWECIGSNWNNGIDDDGNGYIDDFSGWDFIYNDNAPWDMFGHGTHVSGIAAASTNNSIGIAVVAWNCKILVLRVFDTDGTTTVNAVNDAIYYAAYNGAKIINLSLGGAPYSIAGNSAIQYAHSLGCVIIASAGNNGDSTISYPASYDNVISVASVDQANARSYFSNYNSYIDVTAPGGYGSVTLHDVVDIYSTTPTYESYKSLYYGLIKGYDYLAGTSMSAPYVAGFAALLASQNPAWSNTQIENRIFSTVDDLGAAGWDQYYGCGRINVARALYPSTTLPAGISMFSIPFYPPTGESATVTLG